LWKGFFARFSSGILSRKGIPLVEDISRIVEGKRKREEGKQGKGREKGKKKRRGKSLFPS
jgi:hypothetical protein